MDRSTLAQLWKESWDTDTWTASWTKALDGLTPEQAAWRPAPGRHSIWQNVQHVTFWRNVTLDMLAGRPRPSDADTDARQFALPAEPSTAAWADARGRLAQSHQRLLEAIQDERNSLERPRYHLAHDAYHLGQIMYIRALQNLPPLL